MSGDKQIHEVATPWTEVLAAHDADSPAAAQARKTLLERYGEVVQRYLRSATHDRALAEELYQDFALKFLRGDLRRVNPARGRFRDYLITILRNQVARAHRSDRTVPLTIDIAFLDETPISEAEADEFRSIWLDGLMQRSWESLRVLETRSGQPLYSLLRFRADQPEMTSEELARVLSKRLGVIRTASWVRKWLSRARRAFAERLVHEVAQSLTRPSLSAVEDELRDLGILDVCRDALRTYFNHDDKETEP